MGIGIVGIADIVGLVAAGLGTIATAPQVIKVFKTKHTSDLSLGTFGMITATLFLWLIYGLLIRSFPIIAGNAVGFALNLYIVFMKIRHG